MRKQVPLLAVMIFAMQAVIVYAQTTQKPEPGFTLTLSEGRHGGQIAKNIRVLLVKLTNTSKDINYEDVCLAFQGWYNLTVVYNGVPVEDTDKQREFKKQRATGECNGSRTARNLKPGESRDDLFYYDAAKPGTYEFTIDRETFPRNPDKSVTVKSNTLTIVVPEQEAVAPK
jgi:hypothetical protein